MNLSGSVVSGRIISAHMNHTDGYQPHWLTEMSWHSPALGDGFLGWTGWDLEKEPEERRSREVMGATPRDFPFSLSPTVSLG